MKTNRIVSGMLVMLFSIVLLNGCSDEQLVSESPQALSKQQLSAIHAEADRIAAEEVQRIKKSAAGRSPDGYDFVGLNVTTVTGTGPTSANYGFNTSIRNPALLNAGQVPSYNYLFCAAPNHFRYAVVYFYNGYTHSASSIDAFMGPTGGCLSGSKSFSVAMPGANSSQTFIIIFDVLNGPGGGSSQFAGPIWSNSRELTYPNYHILNPGFYWW